MRSALSIGELARATETKVETIRYYERIGLLPRPPRTAGNYRSYEEGHRSRLGFIRRARELGLKVMIGCMNESTVGSAAIAHLLPFIDHVDMDGPLLLEEDLATGIDYDNGKISYSQEPGLGIHYTGLYKK